MLPLPAMDYDPLQHNVDCAKRYLNRKQIDKCEQLIATLPELLADHPRGHVIRTTLMFGQSYVQHRLNQMAVSAETRMRSQHGTRRLEIVKL